MLRVAIVSLLISRGVVGAALSVSNTLGDGMVLQRAPAAAVVWGFASPGVVVTTTLGGSVMASKADAEGVWRQALPPQPASEGGKEQAIEFTSAEGGAKLSVLFGEVYLCSGQSNMAYTARSMAGMNNMSAEIAAADAPRYHDIRLFTVGQGTVSATPLQQLNTTFHNWTRASAAVVGGTAWLEFSAICWLTGREIHDELNVPVGLVSSNWGGTAIQVWLPPAANEMCQAGNASGDRHNAMIAPYAVGPMQMAGILWYQGESNNGQGRYYSCVWPALVTAWRQIFAQASLWVGFVQISGYQYGGASHPDPSADVRQAQLAALALPRVAVATTVDTGDWSCIHPPDKQTPSHRLATAALDQVYGMKQFEAAHSPPLYAGQTLMPDAGDGITRIRVQLSRPATTDVPPWATAPTTLGNMSVPRNACPIEIMPPFHNPQDCGYPRMYATAANGTAQVFNATAVLKNSGSAMELAAPVPPGWEIRASSYGRASWPMTIFFSATGVPVLPWFSALNETRPWIIPPFAQSDSAPVDLDDEQLSTKAYLGLNRAS